MLCSALGCHVHSLTGVPVSLQLFMATGSEGRALRWGRVVRGRGTDDERSELALITVVASN